MDVQPPRKPAKWHRKRSHDGVSWRPPGLQDVGMGIWCTRCHLRHPYNGKDKLDTDLEYRDGKFTALLWICPFSGDVVGQLDLTKEKPMRNDPEPEEDEEEIDDGPRHWLYPGKP